MITGLLSRAHTALRRGRRPAECAVSDGATARKRTSAKPENWVLAQISGSNHEP